MKLWTTQQDYETFVQSANYEEPYVHILSDTCDYNQIIATDSTNLPLMNVARTKGWIDSNATFMTKVDASKVTNAQLDGAFNGNTDLVTFNEFKYFTGITKVGTSSDTEEAKTTSPFRNCTSLTEITIPSSCTSFGARAFDMCSNILYMHNIENVRTFERACLQKAFSVNCNQVVDTLTIDSLPGGYNFNHGHSFLGKFTINNLVITNNVTTLETCSFTGIRIKNIVFPNTLTSIGEACFVCGDGAHKSDAMYNFATLKHIDIPASVTSIGPYAFAGQLNVESVIIRGNVSLARSVFNYVGEDTVVKYYIYSENVIPSYNPVYLVNNGDRIFIYVPSNLVNAYKTSVEWDDFADSIYPLPTN